MLEVWVILAISYGVENRFSSHPDWEFARIDFENGQVFSDRAKCEAALLKLPVIIPNGELQCVKAKLRESTHVPELLDK